jgi:hypothetical protein
MFKTLIAAALVAAPLLTGCQAAAPAAPQAKPVRHVMEAASSGTLFGVQFGGSYYSNNYRDSHDNWTTSETWNTGASLSGKGTLVKASPFRYVYQVPDDQVLILNQVDGGGSISINGYGYHVPQTGMQYMFGPGELVVFNFGPNVTNSYSGSTSRTIIYQGLAISGYTISPDLLGGQGLVRGSK